MTILAHTIRLYPNNKQRTLLAKSCGTARFSYNWALAEWGRQYEAGDKPSEAKLRKQLNAIKKEQYPWMSEVSERCAKYAIKNLGVAFDRFFNGLGKYPKFKKKFVNDRFTLDNERFFVKGKKISLTMIGEIRLAEKLRFEGKLLWATISREADRWYVSIQIETEDKQKLQQNGKVIGIDVGVRQYANSEKRFNEVPRAYRKSERKLRRLQQSLSRKKDSSSNRNKVRIKVARQHAKVKNIRQDWLHKLSTEIIQNNEIIGIEDLNVKGMVRNKHLAKSITDACFGEFRRQLNYKSKWYGRTLVVANRWYASSKICSVCGAKTKQRMSLDVRKWTCEHCGTSHDRDINAAVNLKFYALLTQINAVSSTVSACGEFSASDFIADFIGDEIKQPQKTRKRKKQEENNVSQCVGTLCRNV
jgi:putative transposase